MCKEGCSLWASSGASEPEPARRSGTTRQPGESGNSQRWIRGSVSGAASWVGREDGIKEDKEEEDAEEEDDDDAG